MPNGFVESNVKGVQPHSSARMLSNAELIMGRHSGPVRQLYLHRDGELVYSRRGQDLKTPGLEATGHGHRGEADCPPPCQGQCSSLSVH